MNSVERFPCPRCGAYLAFDPQGGQLKCEYCGWENEIAPTDTTVDERPYEEHLQLNSAQLTVLSPTALEVKCDDCGASVTFEPPKVAGNCPFCASPLVAKPEQASPTVYPEAVIPFQITQKQARGNIQKWLASRWFAPSALKQLAQQERLQGVYLPFWTYDAQTSSQYRGERGDYYYVTVTRTRTNSEGKQETYQEQERRTQWHAASGRVRRFFDDVLVPATQLVDQNRLNALEPWHLKESLKPYNSSYLAGFEAQRAQVTLEQGFNVAKGIMAGVIRSDVCRDIGGDEQRVHHVSTDYSAITFKHIFLPVWLCAYRYQNKRYQVMVNARTGEVQGERPYSAWKITLAVLGALLAVGTVIFLFNVDWERLQFPGSPKREEPESLSPTPAPTPYLSFIINGRQIYIYQGFSGKIRNS